MKKIVYAVLATVSGLVLLFSYKTSLGQSIPVASTGDSAGSSSTGSGDAATSGSATDGSTAGATGTDSSGSGSGSSTTGSGSGSSATGSGTGLKDGTFTGQAADTRYGPVQVEITVSGGRISKVAVPEYPQNDPRDQQINAQAIPQLISETTQAQSASVDLVSGATYTSQGYIQSLQSALDQAK